MGDNKAPKWLEPLLDRQTKLMIDLFSQKMSKCDQINSSSSSSENPSHKKRKVDDEDSVLESPQAQDEEDSDDEFDRKYGHLFGTTDDNNNDTDPHQSNDDADDDADDDGNKSDDSVDEDLIDIVDSVPNWDTSSSLKKFIIKNCDRPLSDEVLKQINEDFTPSESVKEFFKPPDMPSKILKPMKLLKSKGAIKTEKALYSAQNQLFIISKPIFSALIELRPLGDVVKKARELLSMALRGIYSVSIKLSYARRENARFLIRNPSLAEALFSSPPTHSQLFGGSSFSSQLEKAVKDSKIDLSWNRYQKKSSFHEGFQYSKGAGKYIVRNSQQRKQPNRNPPKNYNYNYNNNNNNNRPKASNYSKPKGKNFSGSQSQS